jgi:hypothetical protein
MGSLRPALTTGILVAALLTREGPHLFAAHQFVYGFECYLCRVATDEPPRPSEDGWVHPTCADDAPSD